MSRAQPSWPRVKRADEPWLFCPFLIHIYLFHFCLQVLFFIFSSIYFSFIFPFNHFLYFLILVLFYLNFSLLFTLFVLLPFLLFI
jgi:hypothetical protein